MAFNFELMEEELTCPVCLELYRDPLMLPCSHSLCKTCLAEILNKNDSQHTSAFHCPSCRSSVNITQDSFSSLPKNLVLENIVVRYTEERNKLARRSFLLDSWTFADPVSSSSPRTSGSPLIPCVSSCTTPTFCELCDPLNVPAKAVLVCAQCDVTYCQACFSKYHPNRGALARHKIKNLSSSLKNHRNSVHIQNHVFLNKANASVSAKPSTSANADNCSPSSPTSNSSANCSDHKSEPSTMFCDRCKILVCHVCVCDGEGRHSGHKMLTLETAANSTMNLANHTKEQCESIVSMLKEKQLKMTQFSTEIKDLHKSACNRIEQQFRRFVEDLTGAIEEEKRLTMKRMDEARGRLARRTESHRMESEKCIIHLTEVAASCGEVSGDGHSEVLSKAALLHPVIHRFKKNRKEVSLLRKRCDNLLKDKSGRLLFLSGTEHFRKRVDKLLTWFSDDGLSGGDTIVPKISTSPTHQMNCVSAAEAAMHRVFKQPMARCLTTWGGDANGITTYTGEPVQKQCSWTVTIEHNPLSSSYPDNQILSLPGNSTAPAFNSGSYLFGAGISDDPLSIRDLVGMSSSSRGIACIGGSIYFCSKSELQSQESNSKPTCTYLTRLESLPISLTLALRIDSPDATILSYKMTSLAPDGRRVLSLVGRKIIRDLVPGSKLYPVFTVTSKVKILFPTYV